MRWMWIDRIIELVPRTKLVAIKNVTLAEEHLHDHFAADASRGLAALPVMPACFIIEGMAQSAGILVGHAGGFKEKVVLAKVNRAELSRDAGPGCTLRYTATLDRIDPTGAATSGMVELLDHGGSLCTSLGGPALRAGSSPPPALALPARSAGPPMWQPIGRIDLMFSHIDNNMAGAAFPQHNFVFSESFRTLLRTSGIDADF